MASEKPRFRRFEVFHKRGKRKHIYPPERFARLQKRARKWMAYQVEPFVNSMDFCKEQVARKIAREARSTHFPSELEQYSNTIQLGILRFRLAEAEFNWSRELIQKHAVLGNVLKVNRSQLGFAARRVLEAPREMTRLELQMQEYRDFYSTTKRKWDACWKQLASFVLNDSAILPISQSLLRQREDARSELLRVQAVCDGKIGALEQDIASGMVRSRNRKRLMKTILEPWFVAKEKYCLVLQEWNGFWIRIANRFIKQKRLPETFVDELVRRKEEAVEDTIRARRRQL